MKRDACQTNARLSLRQVVSGRLAEPGLQEENIY